jgi:hypothetical protein
MKESVVNNKTKSSMRRASSETPRRIATSPTIAAHAPRRYWRQHLAKQLAVAKLDVCSGQVPATAIVRFVTRSPVA